MWVFGIALHSTDPYCSAPTSCSSVCGALSILVKRLCVSPEMRVGILVQRLGTKKTFDRTVTKILVCIARAMTLIMVHLQIRIGRRPLILCEWKSNFRLPASRQLTSKMRCLSKGFLQEQD